MTLGVTPTITTAGAGNLTVGGGVSAPMASMWLARVYWHSPAQMVIRAGPRSRAVRFWPTARIQRMVQRAPGWSPSPPAERSAGAAKSGVQSPSTAALPQVASATTGAPGDLDSQCLQRRPQRLPVAALQRQNRQVQCQRSDQRGDQLGPDRAHGLAVTATKRKRVYSDSGEPDIGKYGLAQ